MNRPLVGRLKKIMKVIALEVERNEAFAQALGDALGCVPVGDAGAAGAKDSRTAKTSLPNLVQSAKRGELKREDVEALSEETLRAIVRKSPKVYASVLAEMEGKPKGWLVERVYATAVTKAQTRKKPGRSPVEVGIEVYGPHQKSGPREPQPSPPQSDDLGL